MCMPLYTYKCMLFCSSLHANLGCVHLSHSWTERSSLLELLERAGRQFPGGVLAVHVERNASCLDHIVSYDIICIIVSFVKYGQPMPNANLRCHVWSLCHVSQVAGTLLRFLVEGQPRLPTSYLMMLFWQNMAKSSLVLREMILSCVPWWRAVITQVDDKL